MTIMFLGGELDKIDQPESCMKASNDVFFCSGPTSFGRRDSDVHYYPHQPQVTVTLTPSTNPGSPSPTYLTHSILACLCCFWPIGIAAIVFAIRTNNHNGRGNWEAAKRSSKNAFTCCAAALVCGAIIIMLSIIFEMSTVNTNH